MLPPSPLPTSPNPPPLSPPLPPAPPAPVVHFSNPKVQASISANTYIVSGNAETVGLETLLPGIVSQMGPELIQKLQQQVAAMGASGMPGAMGAPGANDDADSDDDDVPELVDGDFEETSQEKAS